MRAAFLTTHGPPEVIRIGELPDPPCGTGEIRVRVKFAALNHLDLWVRSGLPGLKTKFPHVLGSDAAGVVETVDPSVKGIKVGDEVLIHPGLSCGKCAECVDGTESLCREYKILGEQVSGTMAALISVPARNVFPKPRRLTFEQAAAAPLVFITAWEMLVIKAKVQAGNFVLVHGAGSGVTGAAIQIANLHGAEVAVTSGSEDKLQWAKKLGARHTIHYKTQDFSETVRRLHPGGADIIIDHVGEAFWPGNIRALRSGGTLVTCGATSGGKGLTDLHHLFFRQLRLLGSTMGSKRHFPALLERLASSELTAVVDRTFPLEQVTDAHRRLDESGQFGKVLLKIGS